MRRSRIAGLALVLMMAGATAAQAQQPGQRDRQQRGERGKAGQEWQGRMQNSGFGMLLKDIELTADQKAQLQTIRQKTGTEMRAGNQGERREQMKAARERGDTAAMREFRTQNAAQMKQRHEALIGEIRAILTPAQREVFERNVVDAQKRMQERGQHSGKRGKRS